MTPWRRVPLILFSFILLLGGCGRGGKPEAVWLQTGVAPGEVVYPRGIAYSPADDTFYVVDRMARIQHFDHDCRPLAEWRTPEWIIGRPVGLDVGPDGNLWVPDTHYSRILVYSPSGKLLKTLGSFGFGPGQFVLPTDIKFDSRGRMFVSEYGDHDRIQVFDKNFHFLYQFGSFGEGNGQFIRPESMVIDGDTLYVTDACNHRIDVFNTDGKWLRNFGRCGSGLGEFRFPYGLAQDNDGHLIVSEFGNNRIQLVDKATGKGLKIWGTAGRAPGELAYPWGVIFDKHDRVIAVDSGNNRLQVFEF
ncbi:MAG TPA: hypothetical protein VMD30_05295 [Tepidisphaeraceae bacterium]|nr:hypothetical protein [Tepidisphaeraceae bacterium]